MHSTSFSRGTAAIPSSRAAESVSPSSSPGTRQRASRAAGCGPTPTHACPSPAPTPLPATTASAGNGVATPVPTQAGMVSNCHRFHLVGGGQTCATVAALYSVSAAQFLLWNPAVKSDCSGLWGSTYACVGVIGGTVTPPPTTTSTGSGVATPTHTQPGMVASCKRFALVNPGDTCEGLATRNGISLDQFVSWNTGVGGRDCRSLWARVYVCIGT